MSYYLCVDCGGSKTAAAIADADGNILARATGGPSNFAYLGLPNFLQAVSATTKTCRRTFPTLSDCSRRSQATSLRLDMLTTPTLTVIIITTPSHVFTIRRPPR